VQIGDENVHRVRAVMDEVFGSENFCSQISFAKNSGATDALLSSPYDFVLWFGKDRASTKFRRPYYPKSVGGEFAERYDKVVLASGERRGLTASEAADPSKLPLGASLYTETPCISAGYRATTSVPYKLYGRTYETGRERNWKTHLSGMDRLQKAGRLIGLPKMIYYTRLLDDFRAYAVGSNWADTQDRIKKQYIVETVPKVIERCIVMTTDPGDLVLDPTCGSGTTAYVAEQWGRRWITIDTSRVALALARTRLMAARYPWYLLADSREGRAKEANLQKRMLLDTPVHNDIRQGFVYERVPHITLKSIANNPLIDDIWEKWQAVLEPLRLALNKATKHNWEEWQIPRELPAGAPASAAEPHAKWWEARIARQREIDASIAARADVEYLYDRPYTDNAPVRVAGPFTVESLSPHRVLPASEEELIDLLDAADGKRSAANADLAGQDFATIVIDYLKSEGVKQQDKGDRITFESLTPWPGGKFVGASGSFIEGENGPERRAAILIGPEYGTVGRQDIVAAAREAVDARFDVLIACAFNFDAHSSELGSLGSLKILKARINPDMHMSEELKNTGRGNMFVVFGEPDVEIVDDGGPEIRIKVNGVDVFDPNTGDIRSSDTKGIAAWFIDTDYNEESFFVRHAYFLGANDPYKSLKTALQAEIDEDAWATLYSDTSRPFTRPAGGRIAVKVINHFGDEVMKVFGV
jgi:adenine-specific DNA-methyltransferase